MNSAQTIIGLAALFLLGRLLGWLLGALRERGRWDDYWADGSSSESWWAKHNRLRRERRADRARRREERREEQRIRDLEPWEDYERRTREGWRREAEKPAIVAPAAGGVLVERADEVLFVPPAAGPAEDD